MPQSQSIHYGNVKLILLDENTEKNVMQSINKLKNEKTIIIVAHRLSTVSECDRIYRFKKSKLIQEGKLDEVVKPI